MRIAVIGAGAMGQLFGARLARAGNEVVMIDTSRRVVDRLATSGIALREHEGIAHIAVSAGVADRIATPADLVLLFTKTMHSRSALADTRHLITPETVGVSLQNGLGNDSVLGEFFDRGRLLVGMTDYPADRGADGVITTSGSGSITLGEIDPQGRASAQRVAEVFRQAGLHTVLSRDVRVPIWEKVMFNSALNTISAATGLTVGGIAERDAGRELVNAVVTEAGAVATAAGVECDADRVRRNIQAAFAHHGSHKTSMLVDLEAGRVTEIDSIGGAVVAQGATLGVAAPVLATLCAVVRLRAGGGDARS